MDFIFFQFVWNKRGKNLLIRRDDVTIDYLRRQARQLYRIDEDTKFALCMEIMKDGKYSQSPKGRHFYCINPQERPDKLLYSNKQLYRIRKGKRLKNKDTRILITVHTDSESVKKYYSHISPQVNRAKATKAFTSSAKKTLKSGASSVKSSARSLKGREKALREIYSSPPIKIVRMKVDNTYDYKLPPFYLEAFAQFMLESDEGMLKLNELHRNFPLRKKKTYNVVDYINSMDYVVRLMEIGLGLQYGGIKKDVKNMFEQVNQGREDRKIEEDSPTKQNEAETQDFNSIEFEEMDEDSDDVFAKNPSNIMLAKVKVKRKPLPEPNPENEICQCECLKCKCYRDKPLNNSFKDQKISLNFSQDGNLLTYQDLKIKNTLNNTNKEVSVKSSTTQPTVMSFNKEKKPKREARVFSKGVSSTIYQGSTNRSFLNRYTHQNEEFREPSHHQTGYNKMKLPENSNNRSKNSFSSSGNRSMEMLEKRHQRMSKIKPIRDKSNNVSIHMTKQSESSENPTNNMTFRGIYSDQNSNADNYLNSSVDNPQLGKKQPAGIKRPVVEDHYGNFQVFNKRSKSNNMAKGYHPFKGRNPSEGQNDNTTNYRYKNRTLDIDSKIKAAKNLRQKLSRLHNGPNKNSKLLNLQQIQRKSNKLEPRLSPLKDDKNFQKYSKMKKIPVDHFQTNVGFGTHSKIIQRMKKKG
ncbi:unnamed protein product [Moneuplotes crassus]|uniref:Uncharacterized protein n=1 Tax=Euplotes crassus TaxID=5936 RepID=A0AAD1U4T9_EUPCR|nr:unnamed protein product [Moneuplotes crassus]